MTPTVEDRKFFVRQYLKTMPLNAFSVVFKAAAGAAWALLDSARLLGFYALAATPSAISQRATLASSLAQTILPNVKNERQENAIIRTAMLIDIALMGGVSVLMVIFFLVTRADVVSNLGVRIFLVVTAASLVEAISGMAVHVCNARRHYVWNFFLVNSRVAALLTLLALASRRAGMPGDAYVIGTSVWFASTGAAFIAACLYFWKTNFKPVAAGGDFLERSFVGNVKGNLIRLALFQGSYLLFGSLPSMVLAYLADARDVGLFSFALTLSGFLYAALAPVNEQIFSPTFSRLVNNDDRRLLVRRLVQMLLFTALLGAIGSGALLTLINPLLRWIHRMTFLASYRFLPALLAYQILLMCSSGFLYPLFCMNRFKALAVIYGLPAAVGFGWILATRENPVQALAALPLAAFGLNFLGAIYVWKLIGSSAPLLRRSLVDISA